MAGSFDVSYWAGSGPQGSLNFGGLNVGSWVRSPVLSEFFGKLDPDFVSMLEPPVHR